jgi:hypothetical protein
MQALETLAAGDRGEVRGRDALHLGAVGRFAVAWVAGDGAVGGEAVEVAARAAVVGHGGFSHSRPLKPARAWVDKSGQE